MQMAIIHPLETLKTLRFLPAHTSFVGSVERISSVSSETKVCHLDATLPGVSWMCHPRQCWNEPLQHWQKQPLCICPSLMAAVVVPQSSLILVLANALQRFLIAYQSKSGLMVNCCFRWELILGLGSLRNWSILNSRVFNPLGDKTISHPFVGANYSKDCQLPLVKIKKWTSQWILDLSLWNMTKFVKDLSWYTSWDGEQARVDFMHRFAKKMPGKKWNTHIYIYIYVLPWWFTIKNG